MILGGLIKISEGYIVNEELHIQIVYNTETRSFLGANTYLHGKSEGSRIRLRRKLEDYVQDESKDPYLECCPLF